MIDVETTMLQERAMDSLVESLTPDCPISEQETMEWLALDPSRLRELVRLALLDDAQPEL